MSSLRNPPWWQLPSCARDVCTRSKMAAPIRSSRKHSFFIKITISQYHDIDISYFDIDIGKNAFSMTSLDFTIVTLPGWHLYFMSQVLKLKCVLLCMDDFLCLIMPWWRIHFQENACICFDTKLIWSNVDSWPIIILMLSFWMLLGNHIISLFVISK